MPRGFTGGSWGNEFEFPEESPIDCLDGMLRAKRLGYLLGCTGVKWGNAKMVFPDGKRAYNKNR